MRTEWRLQSLQARIRSLKAEIKRVADKDHPYPEPDTIYSSLGAVLDARAKRLDKAIHEYAKSGQTRQLQATLGAVAAQLKEISGVFNLADRVDSARIPFEILRALSWVTYEYIGEDCHALVRLDGAYNYSIISCRRRFEELKWQTFWAEQAARVSSTPDRFTVLILGFPSPEAAVILLHALAAHEIAHEIRRFHGTSFEPFRNAAVETVKRESQEFLQEQIKDNLRIREGVARPDAYNESARQVEAKLEKIADRWIDEVFADLVASRLVGPAFLAAYDRIAFQLDKASASHPPGFVRRDLVREYLQNRFPVVVDDPVWSGILTRTPSGDDWRTAVDENDPLKPLYPLGERICRLVLSDLSKIADLVPTPLAMDGLKELTDDMEEAIDNLAPPSVALNIESTVSQAMKVWLLMYAAWHFRLSFDRYDKFLDRYGWKEDSAKGEAVLGNLLAHSLQSLELRYRWECLGVGGLNRPCVSAETS
jgi:hypothetical protein